MAKNFEYIFVGSINKTYTFKVNCVSETSEYVYVKNDGYLYIKGDRITNDEESIQSIRSILRDANTSNETHYTEVTFRINDKGEVFRKKHIKANNKFSLMLERLT